MDPEFDEIPSERLQRILSELSNLPKLQLTSLESSSLFKVLPADARHMLDEQPGQLINALSLSKGKHPGMGMFPFLSTVSCLMGHGVVIGPADDADWWQRGLFWSCTVAEPGAGRFRTSWMLLNCYSTSRQLRHSLGSHSKKLWTVVLDSLPHDGCCCTAIALRCQQHGSLFLPPFRQDSSDQ